MEYGTKLRLLKVQRALLDQPYRYTIADLANRYGMSKDAIKADLEELRNAGFVLEFDSNYRYAFVENKPYKELKNLLHFSEEDQFLLMEAIDQIAPHSKKGARLKKKLNSLYDYRKLGHAYLRKPYLTKVDLLEQAKAEKQVVMLQRYRSSNSNRISNRQVEAFHVSPEEDILHAYDVDKNGLRHFRISRIQRVKPTDHPWQHEAKHHISQTDPFRIVNDDQVYVHIRFRVGAYNELVERFPLTKAYIEHYAQEDVYDFACRVNAGFLGITNFILGFHHQLIEVVEPLSLKQHLQQEIKKMQEKLGVGR